MSRVISWKNEAMDEDVLGAYFGCGGKRGICGVEEGKMDASGEVRPESGS